MIAVISDIAKMHYTIDLYKEVETICDAFHYNPPNGIKAIVKEIEKNVDYRKKTNWGKKSAICPSVHLDVRSVFFY